MVSYFAPFSDFVVEGKQTRCGRCRQRLALCARGGAGFSYGGEPFPRTMVPRARLQGRRSPMRAPGSGMFSRPEPMPKSPTSRSVSRATGRSGTWPTSAGWGRFAFEGAHHRTRVSGRFGSVVTDAPLPVTKRRYTGFTTTARCGACVRNCPAQAISLEHGKSHHLCCSYFDTLREKYAPRFGCGKCQVNVPCERRIPKKDKFRF